MAAKKPGRRKKPHRITKQVVVEAALWSQACEWCGEYFESVRKDARFCSSTCRSRSARAAKRGA